MFDPNICIFTIIVRRAFPRSFFTTGPVLRNCRLSNVWSNLKKFWSTFSNAQTFVVLRLLSEGFFHAHFYYRTRVKKLSSLSNVWSNYKSLVNFFICLFMVVFSNKNIIEAFVIINYLIKFFKHLILVILG